MDTLQLSDRSVLCVLRLSDRFDVTVQVTGASTAGDGLVFVDTKYRHDVLLAKLKV